MDVDGMTDGPQARPAAAGGKGGIMVGGKQGGNAGRKAQPAAAGSTKSGIAGRKDGQQHGKRGRATLEMDRTPHGELGGKTVPNSQNGMRCWVVTPHKRRQRANTHDTLMIRLLPASELVITV
jgi:hypothetical protein